MAQRIKGQEVEVLFIIDGEVQDSLVDVRSFEVAAKLEMKEEGYLGEKTNRYDEIFSGMRGRMELHFESEDVFGVFQSIIDRAKRRTPGTQINIKATLNFPNGERPRVLIPDAFFGEIPINFGSRADYGAISLDFQASDFKVL
jgi:hypothetical protein